MKIGLRISFVLFFLGAHMSWAGTCPPPFFVDKKDNQLSLIWGLLDSPFEGGEYFIPSRYELSSEVDLKTFLESKVPPNDHLKACFQSLGKVVFVAESIKMNPSARINTEGLSFHIYADRLEFVGGNEISTDGGSLRLTYNSIENPQGFRANLTRRSGLSGRLDLNRFYRGLDSHVEMSRVQREMVQEWKAQPHYLPIGDDGRNIVVNSRVWSDSSAWPLLNEDVLDRLVRLADREFRREANKDFALSVYNQYFASRRREELAIQQLVRTDPNQDIQSALLFALDPEFVDASVRGSQISPRGLRVYLRRLWLLAGLNFSGSGEDQVSFSPFSEIQNNLREILDLFRGALIERKRDVEALRQDYLATSTLEDLIEIRLQQARSFQVEENQLQIQQVQNDRSLERIRLEGEKLDISEESLKKQLKILERLPLVVSDTNSSTEDLQLLSSSFSQFGLAAVATANPYILLVAGAATLINRGLMNSQSEDQAKFQRLALMRQRMLDHLRIEATKDDILKAHLSILQNELDEEIAGLNGRSLVLKMQELELRREAAETEIDSLQSRAGEQVFTASLQRVTTQHMEYLALTLEDRVRKALRRLEYEWKVRLPDNISDESWDQIERLGRSEYLSTVDLSPQMPHDLDRVRLAIQDSVNFVREVISIEGYNPALRMNPGAKLEFEEIELNLSNQNVFSIGYGAIEDVDVVIGPKKAAEIVNVGAVFVQGGVSDACVNLREVDLIVIRGNRSEHLAPNSDIPLSFDLRRHYEGQRLTALSNFLAADFGLDVSSNLSVAGVANFLNQDFVRSLFFRESPTGNWQVRIPEDQIDLVNDCVKRLRLFILYRHLGVD